MTPPAAASTVPARRSAPRARRAAASPRQAAAVPRGARRASGPAGGLGGLRMPAAPALAGTGGATLTPPLGLRLARRAVSLQDARLLDRLIRGRLWIALIGAMLIGLVFLQLSLLSLNAGIGEALQHSSVLERQNAALRTAVSKMDAGQRVQDVATRQGMVMPGAGSIRYVKAGAVPAAVVVRGIAVPTTQAQAQVTATPTRPQG